MYQNIIYKYLSIPGIKFKQTSNKKSYKHLYILTSKICKYNSVFKMVCLESNKYIIFILNSKRNSLIFKIVDLTFYMEIKLNTST